MSMTGRKLVLVTIMSYEYYAHTAMLDIEYVYPVGRNEI